MIIIPVREAAAADVSSFGGLASVGLSGLLLLLSNMENAKAVRLKGIECFEHYGEWKRGSTGMGATGRIGERSPCLPPPMQAC